MLTLHAMQEPLVSVAQLGSTATLQSGRPHAVCGAASSVQLGSEELRWVLISDGCYALLQEGVSWPASSLLMYVGCSGVGAAHHAAHNFRRLWVLSAGGTYNHLSRYRMALVGLLAVATALEMWAANIALNLAGQ